MKNFFQRPKTQNYESVFLPLIKKSLNLKNIETISKRKILNLYDDKFQQDFLSYRFFLLNEWMNNNKKYTKDYIINLDELINKLFLENELNSFELQYIKNIKAIVFAINRNLKQLIVDFSINPNEFVFYRYELKSFSQVYNKKVLQHLVSSDIYISTQRIIISKEINTISIYYDQIKNYHFSRSRFFIDLKNGRRCYIESNNNKVIVESLKRVIKKEKINFESYDK